MKIILPLILVLIYSACSFRKTSTKNESNEPHFQLYSQPEWKASNHTQLNEQEKRLVFVLTHNLSQQWTMESLQTTSNQKLNKGGVQLLTQYLDILRKKFPGEVVAIDSGNLLSLDNDVIANIQKNIEYSALNLGQLDLQSEAIKAPADLKNKMQSLKLPFVISNLYDISSQAPIEWKNIQTTKIIEKNGVKIGLIGLVSPSVSKKIKVDLFRGLHFDLVEKNVLKYSRYLKRMGANLIVVMLSSESECGLKVAKAKNLINDRVNFDPKASGICEESQIVNLIKKMPRDTVDLYLLSGGTTKYVNFLDGVPVVRPLVNEKSFTYLEMVIKDQKVAQERTILHQPVILCDSFYSSSEDCFTLDKTVNSESISAAKFLDLPIIKQ
jgi:hypothetical protein